MRSPRSQRRSYPASDRKIGSGRRWATTGAVTRSNVQAAVRTAGDARRTQARISRPRYSPATPSTEKERTLGQAIGDLLPSAVGVALSPIPIIAVILILATPKARSNGPAL